MIKEIKLKNGQTIKGRRYYNGQEYSIDYENETVKLSPEFHNTLLAKKLWGRFGYKKIGGSSLGTVLKSNKWGSDFQESIRQMWIGMPIFDTKYIDAGVHIEPKITAVLDSSLRTKLKVFDGMTYNFDIFTDQAHVGGLPDAVDMNKQKVYEIKTTGEKNLNAWNTYGVPEYYKQQVALYDYLMFKKERTEEDPDCPRIVACFLKSEDYADPKALDVTKRVIKTWRVAYPVDVIKGWLDTAAEFRHSVMVNGESFKYDSSNQSDKELLEYLQCKNEEEYLIWLKKKGYIN